MLSSVVSKSLTRPGLAKAAPARRELPLRQLAHQLRHFRLALSSAENDAIRLVWDRLRLAAPDEDKEATRAEHALFDLLLSDLAASEQLTALLERQHDAKLYTSFGDHFKPMPWEQVRGRLRDARDDRDIGCILAFACSHPETVPADAATDLAGLLDRTDPLARYLALMLICRADVESAGKAVSATPWRASGGDGVAVREDHWGSLVLARWGTDLAYEELRDRVAPPYLGLAVAARGFVPDEVRRYGDDLDEAWRHCSAEPVTAYPSIEVPGRPSQSSDFDLPRVPTSEFSRTVVIQDRHSSWGGNRGDPPERDLLSGPSDAELQSMHTRMGEVLAEQRRARNPWFAQRFSTTGLREVVLSRPELVDRWFGGPKGLASVGSRTWLARSFYEALCQVLLSTDPARGAALYHVLRGEDGPVRFVDEETGIPILDFALFDAGDCNEVRALWDSYLEGAACDRDLLVVAALAGRGHAASWFSDRLARDLRSGDALFRIRALRLLGFAIVPPFSSSEAADSADAVEWQEEQEARATRDQRLGAWAHQWFASFVSASSDDVALGAFRMFLRCVDSRYVWWREDHAEISERRRSFLMSADDDIESAITKNEEKLRKEFIGMRVLERQVWPWL